MPHTRARRIPRALVTPLVCLLVGFGCTQAPTAPTPTAEESPALDLVLSLPELDPAWTTAIDSVEVRPETGALRVTEGQGEGGEEDPTPYLDERGSIYDARTLVGFGPGIAYSWGEHRYQGNKGRVETTATVWSGARDIGSQTAVREDYGLFLIQGPLVKYIAVKAEARVAADCGLAVSGRSRHSAWWEWFIGAGSTPSWGRVERPSTGGPKTQSECVPEPGTGGGGSSAGGAANVCWFWIEYDEDTGEVVSAELLFCGGVSEQPGG